MSWRWGEVFELDIEDDLIVKYLDDAIEIGFAHGDGDANARIHLAVLTPEDAAVPLVAAREAVVRFALMRGVATLESGTAAGRHVELAEDGAMACARFAFVAGDVAWLVLALAWGRHVVFFAASAADRQDPIFDRAEALVGKVVPVERLEPAALQPEAAGDF